MSVWHLLGDPSTLAEAWVAQQVASFHRHALRKGIFRKMNFVEEMAADVLGQVVHFPVVSFNEILALDLAAMQRLLEATCCPSPNNAAPRNCISDKSFE